MSKRVNINKLVPKRLISSILVICLIVGINMSFSEESFAAQNDGSTNTVNLSLIRSDMTITSSGSDIIAKNSSGTILAKDNLASGKIILTGESDGYGVVVSGNNQFNIELNNANIHAAKPILIDNNAKACLLLSNNNYLHGANTSIEMNGIMTSLILDGTGLLDLWGTIGTTGGIAGDITVAGGNLRFDVGRSSYLTIIGSFRSIELDGYVAEINILGGTITTYGNSNCTGSIGYETNQVNIVGGNIDINGSIFGEIIDITGGSIQSDAISGNDGYGGSGTQINISSGFVTTNYLNFEYVIIDGGIVWIKDGSYTNPLNSEGKNVYPVTVPATYAGESFIGGKEIKVNLGSYYYEAKTTPGKNISSTVAGYIYLPVGTWDTVSVGKFGSGYAKVVKSITDSKKQNVVLWNKSKDFKYPLTFNASGGKMSATSKTVSYGFKYGTLPTPTRAKYGFTGWWTSAKAGKKISAGDKAVITKATTVFAHWVKSKQKIKFNANKGKVKTKKKTVTYDKKYGKLPTPTRKGYKFKGWYTKKSGGKKITKSSAVKIEKTTTLYAHWQKPGSAFSKYKGTWEYVSKEATIYAPALSAYMTIKSVSKSKMKIVFSRVTNYGAHIYYFTSTAKIKGETASFRYKDDWGNRGKGTIKISGDKLIIKTSHFIKRYFTKFD